MTRITISLPDELADRLRLDAERRQTSVSDVVRILVGEGLGLNSAAKRRLPFAALFDAPEGPFARDIDQELEGWADAIDRDRG